MDTRLLPIGTQDFEIIRKNGFLYVDKTAMIYNLAKTGRIYFLSRPRRFGKSLLVSTLDAYFSGKRELFDGLAMADLEKEWTEYPVIRIDFAQGSYATEGYFDKTLDSILGKYEARLGMENGGGASGGIRLGNIIAAAHGATGRQAVVLVDEYDKPVLDALYTGHEAHNRELLRDFYSPLKSCDAHLRFVFLTGITKVSHVNIFSGLNQLEDISLNRRYSSICGITEAELLECFRPEIQGLADENGLSYDGCVAKLKSRYDGYHFSRNTEEHVYNPFCLLRAFRENRFGSYWIESGTPAMLVRQLEHGTFDLNQMLWEGRSVRDAFFATFDPNSADMAPLLYQTGYLTIRGYDMENELYTIGFPNKEVEDGLLRSIIPKYVARDREDDIGLAIENVRDAIRDGNTEKAMRIISSCIADIPTIMRRADCEDYYKTVVHVILRLTGFEVTSELQCPAGRSDVVLRNRNNVYIFELKMDRGGKDLDRLYEEAFRQIEERGYAKRFEAGGKPIRRVAAVFSSSKKGLVGWKEI